MASCCIDDFKIFTSRTQFYKTIDNCVNNPYILEKIGLFLET